MLLVKKRLPNGQTFNFLLRFGGAILVRGGSGWLEIAFFGRILKRGRGRAECMASLRGPEFKEYCV
jgi:hypothetical protein